MKTTDIQTKEEPTNLAPLLPSFANELEAIEKSADLKGLTHSTALAVRSIPKTVTKGYQAANSKVMQGMGHLAVKHPGLFHGLFDPENSASAINFLTHFFKK